MNIQKRHGALIKNGNIAIRLLLTNAGYIPIAFHAVRELKKDTIKNFDENSYDSIWSKNSEDLDDVLGRANWLCSHVIVNPSGYHRASVSGSMGNLRMFHDGFCLSQYYSHDSCADE